MASEVSSPVVSLLQQYQAWIETDRGGADDGRRAFFTDGLIILDTNVLLDLYRYTPDARNQVLDALQLIAPRLWLPYQVGLEFVRNRRAVIADRTDKLRRAKAQLERLFQQAWKDIQEAREGVKALLGTFADDEVGQAELDELINTETFEGLIKPWKEVLCECIDKLRNSQDIGLNDFSAGSDPILPKVTALYGSRIGTAPDSDELRSNIERAVAYRYPNKIPPGFLDAEKPTALQAAGDYLLWEEMIKHARSAATTKRVLFVSGDVKADWYEPPGPGLNYWRPWPSLISEFRIRGNSDILILETKAFFEGINEFLGAEITSSTVEEITRTAESRDGTDGGPEGTVTAEEAAALSPPAGLPLTAYRAAHLSSSVVKAAVTDTNHRLFQWWLIGATRELALREPKFDEVSVDILAIVSSNLPPAPDWVQGTALPRGEFPIPSSTWISPWMIQIINASPKADRSSLVRLAQRQLAWREEIGTEAT